MSTVNISLSPCEIAGVLTYFVFHGDKQVRQATPEEAALWEELKRTHAELHKARERHSTLIRKRKAQDQCPECGQYQTPQSAAERERKAKLATKRAEADSAKERKPRMTVEIEDGTVQPTGSRDVA